MLVTHSDRILFSHSFDLLINPNIKMQYAIIFGLAGLATTAFGHGNITSPPARIVGAAMTAACGASVSAQVLADPASHIEGLPEALAAAGNVKAATCNPFLCKGLQFADNVANVQVFTPGQVVNMRASIAIPHEGPMNVSVIDTATNIAIGVPLITFVSYADESLAVLPANNTNFNVTIPTDLGASCATAGACVLQWFWFGTAADQTYESCVDFTIASGTLGAEVVLPIV